MGYEQVEDGTPFCFLAAAVSRQSDQRRQNHWERPIAHQQSSHQCIADGSQHPTSKQYLSWSAVSPTHCCPVKSRKESVGWHFRRNWRFGRWPEVRIKSAFSRKRWGGNFENSVKAWPPPQPVTDDRQQDVHPPPRPRPEPQRLLPWYRQNPESPWFP